MTTYGIVSTNELVLHPANPRIGNVDAIKDSIISNGFRGVIIRQKSTGFVLAGNHRVKAARELGITALPVETLDVDNATARRILLADNRAADAGLYDDETLLNILEGLGSLEGTGYTGDDMDDLLVRLEGVLTASESEFRGGYAETEDEKAARTATGGQSRAEQGYTDRVLAYGIEDHKTFLVGVAKLKAKDRAMTTAQAVIKALVQVADAAD